MVCARGAVNPHESVGITCSYRDDVVMLLDWGEDRALRDPAPSGRWRWTRLPPESAAKVRALCPKVDNCRPGPEVLPNGSFERPTPASSGQLPYQLAGAALLATWGAEAGVPQTLAPMTREQLRLLGPRNQLQPVAVVDFADIPTY
jgi:hypothetical protein